MIYDALEAATARGIDVLIADTAGRLHTKTNLMDELAKIARVLKKIDPEAPHEVMLVVDAGTGQNALNQALQFDQAIGLTGITLTKLDGTAKGGIIFAIAEQLGVPIRFIGVGESIEDLRHFDAGRIRRGAVRGLRRPLSRWEARLAPDVSGIRAGSRRGRRSHPCQVACLVS